MRTPRACVAIAEGVAPGDESAFRRMRGRLGAAAIEGQPVAVPQDGAATVARRALTCEHTRAPAAVEDVDRLSGRDVTVELVHAGHHPSDGKALPRVRGHLGHEREPASAPFAVQGEPDLVRRPHRRSHTRTAVPTLGRPSTRLGRGRRDKPLLTEQERTETAAPFLIVSPCTRHPFEQDGGRDGSEAAVFVENVSYRFEHAIDAAAVRPLTVREPEAFQPIHAIERRAHLVLGAHPDPFADREGRRTTCSAGLDAGASHDLTKAAPNAEAGA